MIAEMDMGNPQEIAADFASGIDTLAYGGSHEVVYGQTHRYDLTMTKEYVAEQLELPSDEA